VCALLHKYAPTFSERRCNVTAALFLAPDQSYHTGSSSRIVALLPVMNTAHMRAKTGVFIDTDRIYFCTGVEVGGSSVVLVLETGMHVKIPKLRYQQ
jgi:hypothetical protein